MEQEGFNTLLQFFKVLANGQRLKILGLLANREHSVGELAALLDVKEPTVSHHLARLRELELVRVRAAGTNRFYALDVSALEAMNKEIFTAEHMATLVSPPGSPERALRSFLDGETITQIPAKYGKRQLLLAWLVDKFEAGREYDEKEVNAIITRHHPDYATLRRYLVDEKLLARDNRGTYWRL